MAKINETSWYQGNIYISTVKELYGLVTLSPSYSEWKEKFTYIHGELDTQRKIDVEKLESRFSVVIGSNHEELFKFIYCLETYYSIILRIIVHKTIFGCYSCVDDIFNEKAYVEKGIVNYSSTNCYNWFLSLSGIEDFIQKIYGSIKIEDIEIEGDIISEIFECIFPKEIRHSVGEYYTPYWLAHEVIDNVTKGDNNACYKKFIDPSCGSATFLVALINKYKKSSNNTIFKNVCGIDINPLTVLAAKTNYLLLYCR